MLFYIVKWSILYFILILLMHNLYLYFKKNLTSTKTKDFFNYPNVEYDKIYSIINKNNLISENLISENLIGDNLIGENLINEPISSNDTNKEFSIENFNNIFEKNTNISSYNEDGNNDINGITGNNGINGITGNNGINGMKDELNDFLNNLNKNDNK